MASAACGDPPSGFGERVAILMPFEEDGPRALSIRAMRRVTVVWLTLRP